MNNNYNSGQQIPGPPPQQGGQQQQMAQGQMNPYYQQMMMQQMMMAQQSQMNMGQQPQMNVGSQPQHGGMNPLLMQQQQQMMGAMNPMMMQQQQQIAMQQKKQHDAEVQKKLAQAEPKAALSPKAMELQKAQMEKMKQMMENQMEDLQRTGRSAFGSDTYQIESILTLFGVNHDNLEIIMQNFTKLNIKDSELINLDLNDDKLLKKLIPNTKEFNTDEIRRRFIAWIRYDVKRLHIHENQNDEKKGDAEDQVITLNISGFKYTTLKSTLMNTGSTYFQRLFNMDANSNKCVMDADNNYFIDRNGRLFEPILRYLQTKELNVKKNEYYDIEDVFEELKYYDIQLPAQYDNKTDIRWLPDSFRFEYCCMYNQLQQFYASQFRILPKIDVVNIMKRIGDLPKDCRDIEAFLSIKTRLTNLGYELSDTQVFRGDPSQWTWTYVEFYKRVKWTQK